MSYGGVQRIGHADGQPRQTVGCTDALDQPRELHRRQGPGRHGHRGHRSGLRSGAGTGLEDLSFGGGPARRDLRDGEHRGIGSHPADLAHADGQLAIQHPAHLLGRPGDPLGGVPGRRLLRHGLGRVRAALFAGGLRQPRQRLQLLLGDAVPQALPHHPDQPGRRRDAALLPDQLHADRGSRRHRLLPRAVPARESPALQGGPYHPRRRTRSGPVRGHLHGMGGEQQRLVGGGGDQVLPGRRRPVPDHLRHRHRGLLLRLLQLRESGDPAVPGVHHTLRGSAPGAPAGRRVPLADAIRSLPLAHHRSDSLPAGPPRHHPGPRLA